MKIMYRYIFSLKTQFFYFFLVFASFCKCIVPKLLAGDYALQNLLYFFNFIFLLIAFLSQLKV